MENWHTAVAEGEKFPRANGNDIRRRCSPAGCRSDEFKPDLRFRLAILSLGAGIFVVTINDGLISTAAAALARELDATALQVFWSGTAFLLCSAISQPIFVHLSKFFGRKALVVSALTIYLIGTTVGMTASHINAVIAGRAFQGAGGGGVIVMTEVIITDLIPLRQRGLWLGIINGAFALGSSTGPILGGAIVEKLNWRWLFYIDLPFLALALATVSIFLQGRLDSQNRTLLIKLRSIDWIGITIFLPSVAFFITPLTYGGILFPWVSWQTLGSIALGIIGLLAFAMYEDIRAQNRLADLHIFKQRTVLLTYIANAILYTVFGSQLYYLPLWLQAIKEYSPLMSGIAFLPFSGVFDVMAIVIGALITATAHYRWANRAGFIALALGVGLLALPSAQTILARWIVPMIIAGLGAGTLITSLRLTLQAALTDEETPNAVAIYSLIRDIGMTLGVALGGSIFQNSVLRDLNGAQTILTHARAAEIAGDAASLVPLIASFPIPSERLVVQAAYITGFNTIAIVMCSLTAVALTLSFFMASFSLDRNAVERRQSETAAMVVEDHKCLLSSSSTTFAEAEVKRPESALIDIIIVDLTESQILHYGGLR